MFELKNTSFENNYNDLHVMLKNVSNYMVCEIEPISFEVLYESKIITKFDKIKIYMSNILSNGDEIEVVFHNKESIAKKIKDRNVLYKIYFVWKFQCEDTYHKTYYYKAILELEDLKDFMGKTWNVDPIG